MRPPSLQIKSVADAFNEQGWQHEFIEGRDVITTAFEAHHTRVQLFAQAFTQINSLTIVGETSLQSDDVKLPLILELLHRANKQMNLGGLEYDFDRERLIFRITNIFEKEKYDKDIVSTMVHCAIAEVDRITPYCAVVNQTPEDLLEDLSIERLLLRDDLIPPVPGHEEDTI